MRNPTQDEIHQFQMALRQAIERIADEHKAIITHHVYNADDREGHWTVAGITFIFKMRPRTEGTHNGG